jgi:hypothetical protein
MAQLILTVHTGGHDAAAAVFEDYTLHATRCALLSSSIG